MPKTLILEGVEFIIDPADKYPEEEYTAKWFFEACGLIPWWFIAEHQNPELTAYEVIDKNYIVPFMHNPMTGFIISDDDTLSYEGDPDMYPYLTYTHNNDTVTQYPYGFVKINNDIARID